MSFATEVIKGKKYRLFAELGVLPNGKRERKTKIVEAGGIKEARKLAEEFEDYLLDKMKLDENIPFINFAKKWVKNYASTELEPPTYENYTNALKVIIEYFHNYRIGEIKSLTIVEFFNNEKEQ